MAHAVCARNEVKDLVVYYLGHEWPLSAKQLHKLLKSQRQVSYQGVHKALRELKEANMIIKRGRKYQLNAEFLRQERDFWVEAQKSYYGVSEHSKRLNTETTLTTGKYVFTKQTLSVRGIPSALISKATFEQLIEHNNKKFLEELAKSVAEKDYKYFKATIDDSANASNPSVMLGELNALANDFYWGGVRYVVKGNRIELKVVTNTFTTSKARAFYEAIYVHYLSLLGYALVNRDELSTTYFFEAKKS